jgi:hypothetical protein
MLMWVPGAGAPPGSPADCLMLYRLSVDHKVRSLEVWRQFGKVARPRDEDMRRRDWRSKADSRTHGPIPNHVTRPTVYRSEWLRRRRWGMGRRGRRVRAHMAKKAQAAQLSQGPYFLKIFKERPRRGPESPGRRDHRTEEVATGYHENCNKSLPSVHWVQLGSNEGERKSRIKRRPRRVPGFLHARED